MIPIEELLFTLDTKVNSLNSLKGAYIPDETKIEVLNLSQLKLVLRYLGLNNNYQLGIEGFIKRYEDLQILLVNFEKHAITATGDLLNSYTLPVSSLTNEMLVPVGSYVTATKGVCTDRIIDVTEIAKHSDIRMKLMSPHYKPSFEYQETISSISNDTIYVYGNTEFTMNDLYFSYLRYPVKMDVAGYTHLDNTASTNVDCELDYYLMNALIDIAVEEIADSTGNQSQSQLSRERIKEAE